MKKLSGSKSAVRGKIHAWASADAAARKLAIFACMDARLTVDNFSP